MKLTKDQIAKCYALAVELRDDSEPLYFTNGDTTVHFVNDDGKGLCIVSNPQGITNMFHEIDADQLFELTSNLGDLVAHNFKD